MSTIGRILSAKSAVLNLRFACAFLCLCLTLGTSAQAATFYVATNGDDARTCATATNSNTPKKTINNAVKNCLKAGDTLYIRGGTYVEALNEYTTRIPSGTSWDNPVTIAGFPKEKVVMRPNGGSDVIRVMGPTGGTHHVIFRNLVLDAINLSADGVQQGKNGMKMTHTGSNLANEAHHIRVEECEIMNAPSQGILGCGVGSEILRNHIHHNGDTRWDHGIYCSSKNLLVDGNDLHHNSGFGIHIYASGKMAGPGVVVRNNRSHDNNRVKTGGPGIIIGGDDNVAYNNVVWNNSAGIAVMYSQAKNLKVYNNTIYGNGVGISVSNAPNTKLINNLIFNNPGGAIRYAGENPGLVTENNLTMDPLFVDAAKLDFRLKPGSPMIDKGSNLVSEGVTVDIVGNKRPSGLKFDVGAYEFGASAVETKPHAPEDFAVE